MIKYKYVYNLIKVCTPAEDLWLNDRIIFFQCHYIHYLLLFINSELKDLWPCFLNVQQNLELRNSMKTPKRWRRQRVRFAQRYWINRKGLPLWSLTQPNSPRSNSIGSIAWNFASVISNWPLQLKCECIRTHFFIIELPL